METTNFLELKDQLDKAFRERWPHAYVTVFNNFIIRNNRIWVQAQVSSEFSPAGLEYYSTFINNRLCLAMSEDEMDAMERSVRPL